MDHPLPQAAGLPDASGPLVPPPPDLGTQAAVLPDGAPAAPPAPSTAHLLKNKKKKKRKKQKKKEFASQAETVAILIAQGESVLKGALEMDIKQSGPDLSPLAVSYLVMANMDEDNLCRVGERLQEETKALFPEQLENEQQSVLAMVSAGLALQKVGNNPKEFWKEFRIIMAPIVSSKHLHNKVEKAGESALKQALGMNLRESHPNLSPNAINLLVDSNMAIDKLNIVGELFKLKMKASYGEHMEKEKLFKPALMSAGLTYESHDNDLTKFCEDFILHMKPLISPEELVKQTVKAGESALKLALEEHLIKSYPDLSSLAIRFLVGANMCPSKMKKIGEWFKDQMRPLFPEQLTKEKLSVIAMMAAGLAYERCGSNLKKFWKDPVKQGLKWRICQTPKKGS